MWSVALIVGVAISSSTIVLVSGIVLAVSIERRRYRKFISLHIAGRPLQTIEPLSMDTTTLGHSTELSIQPQTSQAPENGTGKLAGESLDVAQDGLIFSNTHQAVPIASGRRKLRKTRNGSIRKPIKRRKPSRNPFMALVGNPSLPAIAESSEVSQSSFDLSGQVITPLDEQELRLPNRSKPHFESNSNEETHAIDSVDTTSLALPALLESNSTSQNMDCPPLASTSTSSDMLETMAPGTDFSRPLSPNEKGGKQRRPATLKSRNTYTLSKQEMHLSHRHTEQSRAKTIDHNETSASQAIAEFDFEIIDDDVRAMDSPARLTPESQLDLRGTAAVSRRASVSPFVDDMQQNKQDLRSLLHAEISGSLQTENRRSRVLQRRSMFELGTKLEKESPSFREVIRVERDDPFIPNTPSRSSSVEGWVGQLGQDQQSHQQPHSSPVPEFGRKGHKRQNCVRISNLPLRAPVLRPCKLPRIPDEDDLKAHVELPERNAKREAMGCIKPDSKRNSIRYGSLTVRPINLDPKPVEQYFSPALISKYIPSYQYRPMPSATIHLPPSPAWSDFANSPVLPSPAYSKSGMRPRRSPRPGARNSHGNSGFSRRPCVVGCSSVKKHVASDEPHQSVKFVCNVTQEKKLYADNLESVSSGNSCEGSHIGNKSKQHEEKDRKETTATSNVLVPTTHSKLLMNQKQKHFLGPEHGMNGRLAASTVPSYPRISSGDASIWEDASVRNESRTPSPELTGVPTGLKINRLPADENTKPLHDHNFEAITTAASGRYPNKSSDYCNSNNVSPRQQSPAMRLKPIDSEASENVIEGYGRQRIIGAGQHIIASKAVGLGVSIRGKDAVPDTRSSMYDEFGFLKE